MGKAPLLEMKNIKKDFFGNQVLTDINLTLNEGEVIAANGFGKAKTFLQMSTTVIAFFMLALLEKDGEIIISTQPTTAPHWLFVYCTIAFWIDAVVTLLSGLKYAKDGWYLIKTK